jgi:hypothetical protein
MVVRSRPSILGNPPGGVGVSQRSSGGVNSGDMVSVMCWSLSFVASWGSSCGIGLWGGVGTGCRRTGTRCIVCRGVTGSS